MVDKNQFIKAVVKIFSIMICFCLYIHICVLYTICIYVYYMYIIYYIIYIYIYIYVYSRKKVFVKCSMSKRKKCLSNCNGTRTHNHLNCKRTLNHLASLAKWLSVCLQTKCLWVQVPSQSLKLQISQLF